jgi:endonuclease G
MKNLKNKISLIILSAAIPFSALAAEESDLLPLKYKGYELVMDCETNMPVFFRYDAIADTGNEKRSHSFRLDPDAPKSCQQTSGQTYKLPYTVQSQLNKKISYDRGHLVPANHLDYDETAIWETNFMTNIVPMTKTTNRYGAWRQTEIMTECNRSEKSFVVMGGVIVGDNTKDDYFLMSHGIQTPDYLWKVLYDGEKSLSWIIPNSHNATKENLNSYRVSVAEIERRTSLNLPIKAHLKDNPSKSGWEKPKNCDMR